MTDNLREAVRLLGAYTAGRFDLWALAGRSKATCRQHIMTVLLNGVDGKKVPQRLAGVTMMRREFYSAIKPEGDCLAAREKNFIKFCKGD